MNRAVVIRTTAGLARYLTNAVPNAASRGVVVGYDGRRNSDVFAFDCASVLAAEGIRVHLFPHMATTPETSFATAHLDAAAGIMVTASHNPREYNGYKVYWDGGAQIVPPHDQGIADARAAFASVRAVPRVPLEEARRSGLVRDVPAEVTDAYIERISALTPGHHSRDGIRIVYTPLHGVGGRAALAAFARAGFSNVVAVPEQAEPDAEFSTLGFPNPEEKGVMDLAFALAKSTRANLVIANDPDADRLAVGVPSRAGTEILQLTGNQVGVLLGHYLLTADSSPAPNRIVITTIVSSPMLGVIAAELGVHYEEVLTGFKWILDGANAIVRATGGRFVFGYEEALGYTVGDAVRDKDGVGAAVVFADMVAYYQASGQSVLDALEMLYRKYGLWVSRQVSIVRVGLDGARRIADAMERLRDHPPDQVADHAVAAVRDYGRSERRSGDGTKSPLLLPPSNVVAFDLDGGHRVIARPSGTEPKLKFYLDAQVQVGEHEEFPVAQARADETIDRIQQAFLALVGNL